MIVRDNQTWIEQQFGDCELGDRRRTKRLRIVAENMLASPEKSLPQQNTNWSDLKAAYRLFAREQTTLDAVAEQHWK